MSIYEERSDSYKEKAEKIRLAEFEKPNPIVFRKSLKWFIFFRRLKNFLWKKR